MTRFASQATGTLRQSKAVERLRQARLLMEGELRRVAAGDRLPSIRTLRQRCGVGLAQLQAVVAELERDGLIERRLRSGLYKSDISPPAHPLKTIDMIACRRVVDIHTEDSDSFSGHLTEALALEAGRQGIAIRLHQIFASESIARYEALANDPAMNACILMMPHLSELSDLFKRHDVPTIALFPKQPQYNGVVIADSPDIVAMQLDYLWALGHRRIAFLDSTNEQYPDMVPLQRREAYYRLMAHRGLPVESHWVFMLPPSLIHRHLEEYQDGPCHAILDKVFAGPDRPSAIIIADKFNSSLYRYVRKQGWRIGRDLTILGTDDINSNLILEPQLSSVRNLHEDTAKMAVDSILALAEGRPVPAVRHVSLQLIPRASTGPCPPASDLPALRQA